MEQQMSVRTILSKTEGGGVEVWLIGCGSDVTKKEMHLKNIMNYSMEERIIIFVSNMWYTFLGINLFCGAYLVYTWYIIFTSKFEIKVGMLSMVRILTFM